MSETVRFLAGTNIDIKDFIHFFLGQVQKKLKKLKIYSKILPFTTVGLLV